MVIEILYFILAIMGLFAGLFFLSLGLNVFYIDKSTVKNNRTRINKFSDIFTGKTRPLPSDNENLTTKGMVYNKNENTLEVTSRLTSKALKKGINNKNEV